MKKCCLCKKNLADKTGSHIVPHFLLKRIENVDGHTGRNYEIGFVIGESDTKSYIGRSVSVDKIDEIFGKLTDKEISENEHPLIVDNFFCSTCENRFAKIESVYAKSLQKYKDIEYTTGLPSELGVLFWASILWRVSINEKIRVKLSNNQNEKLRRVLDASLKKEGDSSDYPSLENLKEAKRISYRLLRCPNYSASHPTQFFWHPKFKHPYVLIIDEFILLFAFKDNYTDFKRMDLFGIQQEVWNAPINKFNDTERISPIGEQTLLTLNRAIFEKIAELRLARYSKLLDCIYKRVESKQKRMPEEIKQEIFKEMNSEEKKLGRKLNFDNFKESTSKVLGKYLHSKGRYKYD